MSRAVSLSCIALVAVARLAAGAELDAIAGKWLGAAGTPLDRIDVGFEFARDEQGDLVVYLYEPVINFYGLKLGAMTMDGAAFVQPDVPLKLTLEGDALEGIYLTPNTPVTLKRVSSLPAEVPIPDLPRGPGPKWQTKLGGEIYAPAAVRDGVAYVGSTNGVFAAVDASDGHYLWTFVPGRPMFGEALVTDEHVYFVCDNGYLYKLERKAGKEVWRYDLGDERVARPLGHQILDAEGIGEFDYDNTGPRPLLADGVLYVGSGDGSFHAIGADTGARVWRLEGQDKIRTTAALDGPRVIFGGFDGVVIALERATGKEAWRKETHAQLTSAPVVVDGTLVVGNRSGLLAGLDPASGTVRWRLVFWGSAVESTPVPGEGSLFYIGASDLRRVSLIDAKDGRVHWRSDVYGVAWAAPALSGKRLFVSACGVDPYDMRHVGSFSALDRATGKILWRWPVAETPALYDGFLAAPAVAGSIVVVGGLDGLLYGFPTD